MRLLTIALLTLLFNFQAEASSKAYGDLTIKGSVFLKQANLDVLKVEGPVETTGFSANYLEVNGSLIGSKIKMNGDAVINGYIKARESNFKDVKVYSDTVEFQKSKIKTLLIKNTSKPEEKVILDDYSTVTGDITFDSGKGVVILQNGSKVLGKINGGYIK
jgi:predicted acyltransferase (DUF342 family)